MRLTLDVERQGVDSVFIRDEAVFIFPVAKPSRQAGCEGALI